MKEDNLDFIFYIIALVLNNKGEILLTKRKLPINLLKLFDIPINLSNEYFWFGPIGILNKNEKREECITKAILKETGYIASPLQQIEDTSVFKYFNDISKSMFKITMLCKVNDLNRDRKWKKPDYISEIKWINKNKIEQFINTNIIQKWPDKMKKVLSIK